jgi:hypothetical protein
MPLSFKVKFPCLTTSRGTSPPVCFPSRTIRFVRSYRGAIQPAPCEPIVSAPRPLQSQPH